jgi:ferredoxin-NADP reductase
MAMLRYRADVSSDVDAQLLVSARAFSDVLYRAELEQLAKDGVGVHYTLTREQPDGWTGWAGRVNAEMLAALGADPRREPRVFVCGPTGFVEHVAGLLVQLGHDPHAIKTERFGPTGA